MARQKAIDLFVYGTLMTASQVRAVTGRDFSGHVAVLLDFEKTVPAAGYPFVLPRRGCRVDGLVLLDVDAPALESLDAYEDEGHLYHRRPAWALVEGNRRRCQTYVGNLPALREFRTHGKGKPLCE